MPRAAGQRWIPWAVAAIAIAAGTFYAWSASTPALHSYYTPAVVSMSESLRNFVFGAYDSAGLAGIDKIPGSLWPQALSVAVFGANAWSVVVPGIAATVATVVVLYLTAARWRSRVAGLVAAAVYATTPLVAALSKSNVPEVWFALALSITAYLMVRALQSGRLGWLVAVGLAVAAAFQVKMLEAWMVYPAIAIAYLVGAPRPWRTRVWHTLLAGTISVAASLWWIVLVTVTPATDRPWVGNTTDNSAWSMVFGYNGFGRVTGDDGSFVASFAGDPGLDRLVGTQVGVDVAWFLPLAVVAGVMGIVLAVAQLRTPRDATRSPAATWARLGGYVFLSLWLVPVALVMAYSAGIHTFYVAAFAPAIALLVGGLAAEEREHRRFRRSRLVVAALLVGQAAWTAWLVLHVQDHLWLAVAVPVGVLLGLGAYLTGQRIGLLLAGLALLLAPVTWAVGTAGSLNVSNPSSGVSSSGGGTSRPSDGRPSGTGPATSDATTSRDAGASSGGSGGGATTFASSAATELRTWLEDHSTGSRYLVAADSSTAGDLVLAGAEGVVALGGGYHGTDPTPTAEQLAAWVADGDLTYVVVSADSGRDGRGSSSDGVTAQVTTARDAWIEQSCTVVADAPTALGTVYDCTGG